MISLCPIRDAISSERHPKMILNYNNTSLGVGIKQMLFLNKVKQMSSIYRYILQI